ncbi:bidirectional sugar transporter SWEET14-like [Andrographis paniculata]|uniref:bidirectional sugar transporter SWEET14-like n=1 Tax=Andrographis paniculata TaxID=175694 RepID=UPI0021E6D7A4|nr:bidirectional sugar transporter SWEET14-like [Andrographis paniculata]
MMTHLAFVFGLLGNIVSFMVLLSPLPTFYEIFKKKSTEGFQSVLYVVGLFSAMLWIYYSLLKGNMILLMTINSIACFIYSAYICFFIFFAHKHERANTVKLFLLLNVIGFGLIVLLTYLLEEGLRRVNTVGWICLIFSLCVFVAPLCILRKVIRSKSVEYMPFLPSFFLTLSAVMWLFYGLLLKDYNIAIPNVLGFSFGVVQMVVYIIYRNVKKKEPADDNDIITVEDEELKDPTIMDAVKLSGLAV